MAGFEGTQWAEFQGRYMLKGCCFDLVPMADKVPAVSRSIHYGLCLAFEGIRYFVSPDQDGALHVRFLNLEKNLQRFRRAISFNLSSTQQLLVPTAQDLEALFLEYLRAPEMKDFIQGMADNQGQGYLRPFTVDEARSIGVTFPDSPSIRLVTCTYESYMGEPFSGVVVPHLVRAISANGTGCLKLGVNYLLSVKAMDEAQSIEPEASSALFLDDRLDLPLWDRKITEWDSSCCLVALTNGTVIKIPDGPLILPSVTVQGLCALLQDQGVRVEERDLSYGEFRAKAEASKIAAVCSVGTAGILNRAQRVVMVDENNAPCGEFRAQTDHEMYKVLGDIRSRYWEIYQTKIPVPTGQKLSVYAL